MQNVFILNFSLASRRSYNLHKLHLNVGYLEDFLFVFLDYISIMYCKTNFLRLWFVSAANREKKKSVCVLSCNCLEYF